MVSGDSQRVVGRMYLRYQPQAIEGESPTAAAQQRDQLRFAQNRQHGIRECEIVGSRTVTGLLRTVK